MEPRTREGSTTNSAMQAALLLRPHDQVDPIGSVADRDAVGNVAQAPVGELENRALGFQSKALPSFVDNLSF